MIAVHGDPGPAAALCALIEEAGIEVTRDPTPHASEGFLALPGGTRLALTDGSPATADEAGTYIKFDLALDYRTAARIALAPSERADPEAVAAAIGLFQALGKQVSVVGDVPGLIVARTVALLVDFAADAVGRGVASAEDTDTALRLGVNYPAGRWSGVTRWAPAGCGMSC